MTDSPTIVCKPTRWFLFRAAVMILMFGVFAVMFYIDGSTGYRKKNEIFYLHQTFQKANSKFAEMNSSGSLNADEWKAYADKQTVDFGKDPSVLPANLKQPMPWPAVLQDYDQMKPLQWNLLWREYTKERGLPAVPVEKPYDAGKIAEQWGVFIASSVLATAAAFILLRTIRRSFVVDDAGLVSQKGVRVPYADMRKLDLRKWETKGLAFLDYDGSAGKGRVRIDGLTYGGFKKEDDEPAERLMRKLRSHFSGEITEYATVAPDESKPGDTTPA